VGKWPVNVRKTVTEMLKRLKMQGLIRIAWTNAAKVPVDAVSARKWQIDARTVSGNASKMPAANLPKSHAEVHTGTARGMTRP